MNAARNTDRTTTYAVDQDLERLRQILLGEDFRRLLALRDEINDDEQFSARIAAVITRAMELRSQADSSIARVLAPIIDEAVSGSVANDPHRLANSIYPIMGPAIRKSISEAINEMLANFNAMLTLGLTWESIGWRYTAWKTGRSYAEVALLNSLEYRVEQVFLIHCETGLVLQHVAGDTEDARDPDMVSGMLTAIESFIADSFATDENEGLDTMRLGALTVFVQQGPYAFLAAVVRGHPPADLRRRLTDALERIHLNRNRDLQNFNGDQDLFNDQRSVLEALLVTKKKAVKRGVPWVALSVLAALLVLAAWWWAKSYQHGQQVAAMGQRLDAEPGLVVMKTFRSPEGDIFTLLVDPDARDPGAVLEEDFATASGYHIERHSHASLDDEIVARRAQRLLAPPSEVAMSVNSGVLTVSGKADRNWMNRLEASWRGITGIRSVDSSELQVFDTVQEQREALIRAIEETLLEFDVASTEIGGYSDMIPVLAGQIAELDVLQQNNAQGRPRVDIVGYTDETGSRRINHEIGTQRAETVRAALVAAGVDPQLLNASDSLDYYNVDESSERLVRLFVHLD